MERTKEKGITLLALVITIVVLLILTSIGMTSGISTINGIRFSQFENELKILQTKINEINQNNKIEIGTEINQTQKDILNLKIIKDIIYKGNLTEEEKLKIQKGFRYCENTEIKNKLGLEEIKRNYLINIEYRYVICCEGFEYNQIIYYMIDQIEDGMYNVRYSNKNEQTDKTDEEIGFDIIYTQENDRWKIEIKNIEYNQYINNWQVQYRLETDSYWNNANSLSFYITQSGNYYIQLVHNQIKLGPKRVELID